MKEHESNWNMECAHCLTVLGVTVAEITIVAVFHAVLGKQIQVPAA